MVNESIQHEEKSLTKENDQPLRSDDMKEELLDYGDDFEPTEQEKAELEMYEKELESQEAQQQRAEMEVIEKRIEDRTEKLGDAMNFTEGATSNMRIEDDNGESEDDLDTLAKESQKSITGKGGDKEELITREIKTQPAVAQKKSQRIANQSVNIQEQATKLKAMRNEITGNPQFTIFIAQSSNKLAKIANNCKIKLGNETEAHRAIDRLKAQEAAKDAILEAKQKIQKS